MIQLTFFDDRLRPLAALVPTSSPPRSAKTRRRIEERVCCDCGVTWDTLVVAPETMWRGVGGVVMMTCSRCVRYVCSSCDACYGYEHLCSACFALPPPTAADFASHPLVLATHEDHRAERIANLCQRHAWRYAEPNGQHNEIEPARGWYWQNVARLSAGVTDKENTRRLHVAYSLKPALAGDAAWLPTEIAAFAAALYARRSHGASGDEDDGDDDA